MDHCNERSTLPYTTVSSWALLVWRGLESYGIDPLPVFRGAGLDPARLHDSHSRYPGKHIERAWLDAQKASGDPCFGLRAAECWHPTTWHALGIAWLASRTLKDGFERIVRYIGMLTSGATAKLVREDGHYRFFLESTITLLAPAPDEETAVLAVFVNMARMSWGRDFRPAAVLLARPEPVCGDRIRKFFGSKVVFDTERYELVMHEADLERPLPTGNAELLAATDKVIADYMARLTRADVSTRARSGIMEALPSGHVSDESIAAVLNMSARTFQRRLSDEGTTFKQLVEEVRRDLAMHYIRDPGISITELSYLLGFSEPSSFARVFKRWTGKSPSAARQTF